MAKRRLDEFELRQPIGVGTVGTIYRARDLRHEREVALKILLPAVSREPIILARFERETVILEKLSHPNIVQYYGGGRSDDQLFYAMELMTGGSLKDLLAGGPLSVFEAITCGVQIASALQHAHNHGVIHRDLKPSNLMFDQNGNLKLVDFGIARDTHGADITASGLTVGSHAYMAPEQIQGKHEITGHVDLYAFGCLLFELLTASPPFQGDNFAQLFEQHLHGQPPSLRGINPRVPARLQQLVEKLLQKSPEQRPFSARAVQGILLEMIDQQPEQTDPQSAVPAAEVIDRGRQMLASRVRNRFREVSWYAVGGVLILGALIVWAAWKLGI